MSKTLSTPPNPPLNRTLAPYVIIYGDGPGRTVTRLIQPILQPTGALFENIDDFQTLRQKAAEACLIIIAIGDQGENIDAGSTLSTMQEFIANIIGVTREADTGRRFSLMASGFDMVFNENLVQAPEFKRILLNQLERGRTYQTNRIMHDEYRRFRAALRTSPDAFIVIDTDLKLFFVSEHYKRAYPRIADKFIRGLPVEEAFELARREEGVLDDDPRYEKLRSFWSTLKGQVEFTNAAGRTLRVRAGRLEDQGYIITTTDVTDLVEQRKQIEEKSRLLAEALEKEKEASALQKQFIGMVSHEFRTPLAIIDGHAQVILRRNDLDANSIKARCRTIRSAVSRLVHMMESVLSSNMLKTGRMDPDPETFNLGELIAELCQEQIELSKPGIITWNTAGLRGDVRLDRKMMTLVLTNLLSNAVKFSRQDPKIVVSASTDGDNITIIVADNGVGIPESDMARIFERYFRASTSTGIPGTGIGLNLVRNLIEMQRGTIGVDSRVGQGSTFTINLRNLN